MPKNLKILPFIPFVGILILMVILFVFPELNPITWQKLKIWNTNLKQFSDNHVILTPFLFICAYVSYSLLSIPGIFLLSLIAGSLFPQPLSTLYATLAATIGAALLFLAASTAFGQFIFSKYKKGIFDKMEKGFRQDAANYLLFLRLIPLFPFCIVNIAGAFFKVPFLVFVWTTFVGMIPSIFVYTHAGKGLTLILQSSDPLNPSQFFNFSIVIALCGLALLFILPPLFRMIKIKLNE